MYCLRMLVNQCFWGCGGVIDMMQSNINSLQGDGIKGAMKFQYCY
jgi:hypothetical protein